MQISKDIDLLIQSALHEDLGASGDVTSKLLLDASKTGEAYIIAKQAGVVAGLPIAEQVFRTVDHEMRITALVEDGAKVRASDKILTFSGSLLSILAAERTALNFLQRLSGIATLTSKFVEAAGDSGTRILDTRKTTPGLRSLEKYAVRVGGGQNHRTSLYDMILIKENHIKSAGGLRNAVTTIKGRMRAQALKLKIEVECQNLQEVKDALASTVDRIMLDNMSIQQVQDAVQIAKGRVELEVSGGITLENVGEYAETGVDFISAGALTHSARALDLSLLLEST